MSILRCSDGVTARRRVSGEMVGEMSAEQSIPETMFDFGAGPIPAHRHENPAGSEGGWVADTPFVASTAFVGRDARVYGEALVSGSARVYSEAWVSEGCFK